MSEYIKKSEAYRLLKNKGDSLSLGCSSEPYYKAADMISCMKSEDVKPVVRGEWIFTKNNGILDYYKCSRCENKIEVYFDKLPTEHNFCSHCGADMRGDN